MCPNELIETQKLNVCEVPPNARKNDHLSSSEKFIPMGGIGKTTWYHRTLLKIVTLIYRVYQKKKLGKGRGKVFFFWATLY